MAKNSKLYKLVTSEEFQRRFKKYDSKASNSRIYDAWTQVDSALMHQDFVAGIDFRTFENNYRKRDPKATPRMIRNDWNNKICPALTLLKNLKINTDPLHTAKSRSMRPARPRVVPKSTPRTHRPKNIRSPK